MCRRETRRVRALRRRAAPAATVPRLTARAAPPDLERRIYDVISVLNALGFVYKADGARLTCNTLLMYQPGIGAAGSEDATTMNVAFAEPAQQLLAAASPTPACVVTAIAAANAAAAAAAAAETVPPCTPVPVLRFAPATSGAVSFRTSVRLEPMATAPAPASAASATPAPATVFVATAARAAADSTKGAVVATPRTAPAGAEPSAPTRTQGRRRDTHPVRGTAKKQLQFASGAPEPAPSGHAPPQHSAVARAAVARSATERTASVESRKRKATPVPTTNASRPHKLPRTHTPAPTLHSPEAPLTPCIPSPAAPMGWSAEAWDTPWSRPAAMALSDELPRCEEPVSAAWPLTGVTESAAPHSLPRLPASTCAQPSSARATHVPPASAALPQPAAQASVTATPAQALGLAAADELAVAAEIDPQLDTPLTVVQSIVGGPRPAAPAPGVIAKPVSAALKRLAVSAAAAAASIALSTSPLSPLAAGCELALPAAACLSPPRDTAKGASVYGPLHKPLPGSPLLRSPLCAHLRGDDDLLLDSLFEDGEHCGGAAGPELGFLDALDALCDGTLSDAHDVAELLDMHCGSVHPEFNY